VAECPALERKLRTASFRRPAPSLRTKAAVFCPIAADDDGEVRQEFSICVACDLLGGEMAGSTESHEVRWFSPDEIPELPMQERIRARLTDYLNHARAVIACILRVRVCAQFHGKTTQLCLNYRAAVVSHQRRQPRIRPGLTGSMTVPASFPPGGTCAPPTPR